MVIDPTLVWGTYFGGDSNDDGVEGISTDKLGNVFITGQTYSPEGVATSGAYQTFISSNLGDDAFLAKFTSSGNLLWATYFGGPGQDYGTDAVSVSRAGSYSSKDAPPENIAVQ